MWKKKMGKKKEHFKVPRILLGQLLPQILPQALLLNMIIPCMHLQG